MNSDLKLKDPKRSKSSNLRFADPLKILVIEPKGEYCKTVWCAIGLGMSSVMIGAVNMVAFLYSTKHGDKHPIICTLAFHFFSAQAILSLNYANGWSTPMRLRHRRLAHVILQLCGMALAIAGIILALTVDWPPRTVHGITGFSATLMGCINLLSGTCALWNVRFFRLIHMGFGIPTFILSSVSIIFSFFTPNFKNWANDSIIAVLIVFVVFYTVFMITTVFIKFVSNL